MLAISKPDVMALSNPHIHDNICHEIIQTSIWGTNRGAALTVAVSNITIAVVIVAHIIHMGPPVNSWLVGGDASCPNQEPPPPPASGVAIVYRHDLMLLCEATSACTLWIRGWCLSVSIHGMGLGWWWVVVVGVGPAKGAPSRTDPAGTAILCVVQGAGHIYLASRCVGLPSLLWTALSHACARETVTMLTAAMQ